MFMLLFINVACEQTLENEDVNLIKTNLSGDWTVNAYLDNNIIFGPFTVSTQMTSENESIYIKDNGGFWNFQTKALIVSTNNSFETNASTNELSIINAKIKVLNGNLLNKDSIVFDIQFEDDETPYGYTYKITGRRKL